VQRVSTCRKQRKKEAKNAKKMGCKGKTIPEGSKRAGEGTTKVHIIGSAIIVGVINCGNGVGEGGGGGVEEW